MSECNTDKKNSGNDEIAPSEKNSTNLLDSLSEEARAELMQHGVTELVSVSVNAVPDPERPEDHLAMKITVDVGDNFRDGIPSIDHDLNRVDAICSSSGDDLTLSMRDELLVTLDMRRRNFAGMREGKVDGRPAAWLSDPAVADLIRPSLENPVIDDLVWCLGWSATKEADGRLLVFCTDPLLSEYVDEDSWVRIQDRMRRVNYIIGGMMGRLLGEESYHKKL